RRHTRFSRDWSSDVCSSDLGALAAAADASQDVYLVPGFVGLGAPHWESRARGALFGLTRASGPAELARAALESVCYQTRDLIERSEERRVGKECRSRRSQRH